MKMAKTNGYRLLITPKSIMKVEELTKREVNDLLYSNPYTTCFGSLFMNVFFGLVATKIVEEHEVLTLQLMEKEEELKEARKSIHQVANLEVRVYSGFQYKREDSSG